jgi:Domain of unknown function (DUF4394)/Calx-beta domain
MPSRIVVALVLAVLALAVPASASAIVYAVTDASEPRLLSFDPATPGSILAAPKLSGLDAGEVVRGMDLRPATGGLYVLTTTGGGAARIRALDAGTGALSGPLPLAADPSDLTSPYASLTVSGGVGVDFNPVPDRLRVVTAAGEDDRVNPATGLVITDAALNPGTPQGIGAAYTNSYAGAVTTTLYDIDGATNSLAIQNPPNNGTLTPVGALGITPDNDQDLGFDITPAGNAAYLIAGVAGVNRLYAVNLTTGLATPVGAVGNGATPIRGFAIANNVVRPGADVVVHEGAGTATVTVERLSPHLGARVDYATANGTAVAGTDYDARSGTLVFAAGETTKTITIPLRDDTATEASKSFTVVLSNLAADSGTTATLPGPATATVSITDDDAPDRDGDGVPDATDTCPNVADPSQADADHDGIGSACDLTEPDNKKPVLLAAASEIKRAQLRKSGLRVRFSCSEACTVMSRLLAGRKVVAKGTGRLTGVGASTLRLKPSKKGIAAIGRRKKLKVALTARDATGNVASYTFAVRVV